MDCDRVKNKMMDGRHRGSSRRKKDARRFKKAKIGRDQSAAKPVGARVAWLDRDEYETTPLKPLGEISIFTLCRFNPWRCWKVKLLRSQINEPSQLGLLRLFA